jgi:autonomous glycyl radical cofactor GrcA
MGKKTLNQLYKILDKVMKQQDNKNSLLEHEKLVEEAEKVSQLIHNERVKLLNFLRNKTYTNEEKKYIYNKIKSRKIMSKKDIPPPKKAESESDKENKKPLVSESSMKPLTKTQQNNLIRKIPDDEYTEAEILKIVKHIRNGKITKVSQMPNITKKEPKAKLSDVVLDKKKMKGGAINEDNKPLKPVAKKGRPKKIKTEEEIKAEQKALADKLKKKESKLKPYYGIDEIPKGYRRATMVEAKQKGKINYWGVKKVDNKILTVTEETDPKKLKEKISRLTIKVSGFIGKITRLKKELNIAKNNKDSSLIKSLLNQIDAAKTEILTISDKINAVKAKLANRGTGFSHESDDDADSDTDNIAE